MKTFRIRKNGHPYWITVNEGRVEGYNIEWHVKDDCFSGEFITNISCQDEVVEVYSEDDTICIVTRNWHGHESTERIRM